MKNEIACSVEFFAESGEMWHLHELNILRQADKDLKFILQSITWPYRSFVDFEEKFVTEDAEKMAEELRDLWKDLAYHQRNRFGYTQGTTCSRGHIRGRAKRY